MVGHVKGRRIPPGGGAPTLDIALEGIDMRTLLIVALFVWFMPYAIGQKPAPKAVEIPCRTTINDAAATSADFAELTSEKLASIKSSLTDCVLTERRLSRQDILTAYTVSNQLEIEIGKRVVDIVTRQQADYDDLKGHGKDVAELFIKTDKQFRNLIEQYNALVNKYNALLDTNRANINQSIVFGDQMKQLLDAQTSECGNAVRNALQSLPVEQSPAYQPSRPTHCTTQTIGAYTYTNCN